MANEEKSAGCLDWHCALCTLELGKGCGIVRCNADGSVIRERSTGPDYHCRCSGEHEHDSQAPSFHHRCYAYWGGGNRANDIGEVTRPALVPIKGQVLADTVRVCEKITISLAKYYGNRLPAEIYRQIAEYLVGPYCAATTLLTRPSRPREVTVAVPSEPVWAEFIKYHETFYIASVSNTAYENTSKTSTSVLIYSPPSDPDAAADVIYIGQDPWGVRKVLFAKRDVPSDVRGCPGIWWCTVVIKPRVGLRLAGDGIKLRRSLSHSYGTRPDVLLHVPMPPILELCKGVIVKQGWDPVKVMPLVINAAGTTGYRVGLGAKCLVVLPEGCSQSDGQSRQVSRRDAAVWLFVPINPGDWVTQLVIRMAPRGPAWGRIIFALRSGKVHVMGEHPRPGTEHRYKYYTLLNLADSQPVTIYADTVDNLRCIMVPRSLPNNSQSLPNNSQPGADLALPQPISAFPLVSPKKVRYAYTKATLEGVSHVCVCRRGERIIGLLLVYGDGSRASLGSVDLGRLEGRREVDVAGIWIKSAYTKDRGTTCPQVVGIATIQPTIGAEQYLHVAWRGELEWWWSSRRCELHYDGQQTLPVIE